MKSILLLLVCFAMTAFGQTAKHENGSTAIATAKSPEEARKIAQSDIKMQSISLFVQGGFAPTVGKSDLPFETKYKVKIRDFGCTALEYKIISAYNHQILQHLTAKYGDSWRKEIRKDVIGLRDFKQAK